MGVSQRSDASSKEPIRHGVFAQPEYEQGPGTRTDSQEFGFSVTRDILSQKDSWAGVGAKNAKSSLLLSLLAVERGVGLQESLSGVPEPSQLCALSQETPHL